MHCRVKLHQNLSSRFQVIGIIRIEKVKDQVNTPTHTHTHTHTEKLEATAVSLSIHGAHIVKIV